MATRPEERETEHVQAIEQEPVSRAPSRHDVPLLVTLLAAVVVAVLAVHWPVLSSQALSFDDSQYLLENELVRNPSLASAGQFLCEVLEPSTVGGYYQPLSMISLMIDYALGGRPEHLQAFHRTSLGLHVVNTILVVVLLYLLFRRAWPAALVGLLYGLHPMSVEAIAWVGERKTLLAAFFALWCLIFHARAARGGGWKFHAAAMVAFVLGLMSKPTTIPLPVLLLLLDYWPLRRLAWRTVLEKIPLFVLGGIAAAITLVSQSATASVAGPGDFPASRVPLVLCYNIVFYLHKLVWPVNLTAHYPFPEPLSLAHPMVLAGVVGTFVLLVALVCSLRWTRALLTGWLFFFFACLPTMGVIAFANVIAADRFVYLPVVGVLLSLAWFLGWAWDGSAEPQRAWRGRRVAVLVAVLMLAASESFATRAYLAEWRDSETHYRHMLVFAPRAPDIHLGLGSTLLGQGRADEALEHYRTFVALKPNDPLGYYNTGLALAAKGALDEAIAQYREALRRDPEQSRVHNNLAVALAQQGNADQAVAHFQEALRLRPGFAEAHNNLGLAYAQHGRIEQAIGQFNEALQLAPDYAEAHFNAAVAWGKRGDLEEAAAHFSAALRLKPDYLRAQHGLGAVRAAQGRLTEAAQCYRNAVRLEPNSWQAHLGLAEVLLRDGKLDEALECSRSALKLEPRNPNAYYTLGHVLMRMGRRDEAISALRAALRVDPQHAGARQMLDTLGGGAEAP